MIDQLTNKKSLEWKRMDKILFERGLINGTYITAINY